jgi:hypothetical protein
VTKHEALAVRRKRQRLLGTAPPRPEDGGVAEDWVDLLPAGGVGPAERVERKELIARSREALQALKPAELRALTLLAEGYSYAEISELTGFSATKVNRCLAEGRERFRRILSGSEDGSRCRELQPLLSALCDGEAGAEEERAVREHLRACAGCRATLRSYRAAAPAAGALAPGLAGSRSLLERAGDLIGELQARLMGTAGADPAVTQIAAAGGAKGVGLAGAAKLLAICGAAGGAAACVAAGVAPAPVELPRQAEAPSIKRVAPRVLDEDEVSAPRVAAPNPVDPPAAEPEPDPAQGEGAAPAPAAPVESPVESGAVEYAPPPEPVPPPSPPSESGGGAAGEFGP